MAPCRQTQGKTADLETLNPRVPLLESPERTAEPFGKGSHGSGLARRVSSSPPSKAPDETETTSPMKAIGNYVIPSSCVLQDLGLCLAKNPSEKTESCALLASGLDNERASGL